MFESVPSGDAILLKVSNSNNTSKYSCVVDSHIFLAHGGRERTQNEFENLCNSFGFSKFYVPCSGILR
ncbi:hypothetical protein GYH30_054350 [Glycine max]|uniref:Uncharacterized protein n=2 Tax=Glycine subgen. Soja TaxID=1462606 RepID=K7N0K1_SOYBN|nr:hypothetical protein GYH30_054350 [Glycine max]